MSLLRWEESSFWLTLVAVYSQDNFWPLWGHLGVEKRHYWMCWQEGAIKCGVHQMGLMGYFQRQSLAGKFYAMKLSLQAKIFPSLERLYNKTMFSSDHQPQKNYFCLHAKWGLI